MSEKIDWVQEAALFALDFEDPIAKVYEMFPDEDGDHIASESVNNATESSNHSESVDKGNEAGRKHLDSEKAALTAAKDAKPILTRQSAKQIRAGMRYWCGEDGCKASRMVTAGKHPHIGMAQHYRRHHRGLWLDTKRLVAHEDGTQGQKCLPMRARNEHEVLQVRHRSKPQQEGRLKEYGKITA